MSAKASERSTAGLRQNGQGRRNPGGPPCPAFPAYLVSTTSATA